MYEWKSNQQEKETSQVKPKTKEVAARPVRTAVQGGLGLLATQFVDAFITPLDGNQFAVLTAAFTVVFSFLQTLIENGIGKGLFRSMPVAGTEYMLLPKEKDKVDASGVVEAKDSPEQGAIRLEENLPPDDRSFIAYTEPDENFVPYNETDIDTGDIAYVPATQRLDYDEDEPNLDHGQDLSHVPDGEDVDTSWGEER